MVEPTEEEKRNGWTAETLTKYINEQKISNSKAIFRKAKKPRVANSDYSPFRWQI